MKIYATFTVLAALLFFCVPQDVCGQKKQNSSGRLISANDISVSFTLSSPPRIGFDKQEGELKSDYKWFIVKVLYKFNSSFRQGFTLDNMRCEVYLRTQASSGGWRRNYWFTGTQKFYSVIPGKTGTVHRVTLFMPPPLFYKSYANSKSSAKALKECDAIIFFYDGDRIIGQKMWSGSTKSGKMSSKQESSFYAAFKRMNNLPANKIVNGLWPREKTPWQWLSADRMDLPVPSFEKESSQQFTVVRNGDTVEENNEKDTRTTEKNTEEESAAVAGQETESIEFTRSAGRKKRNNKRNR